MNKKKIAVIGVSIGVAVAILIILVVGIVRRTTLKDTDGYKFKSEYEELNDVVVSGSLTYPKVELPDDNIIKYSTIEEVLDLLNNSGDGVVYFGYSTCLYCRNAIQVLVDIASETELDVIYYIDIEDLWDVKELDPNGNVITTQEAAEKYYQLLSALGDELVTDYVLTDSDGTEVSTGVKRLEVPLVIFITNGQVSSYNKGTLFSQEDPLVEMDKYQKEGLGEIYGYGIRDVVDSKKNKGLLG